MRRVRGIARWLLLVLVIAGAGVFGSVSAVLRTDAGREALGRALIDFANGAVRGSVSVTAIGGSFTGGLLAKGVRIVGDDGVPLVTVDTLNVRYRLRDLLGGRIVLGQLILSRPHFNLVDQPGKGLNLISVLNLRGSGEGVSPLVAFRDVKLREGLVEVRTPVEGPRDSTLQYEERDGVLYRVRRFENLNATVPYLRLASPFPGERERGVLAEVLNLATSATDPRFESAALRGTARLVGDSLELNLPEVRLGGSRMRIRGWLYWTDGPLRYDLAVNGSRLRTRDIPRSMQPFPAGLSGTGDFDVVSGPEGMLSITGRRLRFRARANGGALSGNLGVRLGPGARWAMVHTDIVTDSLDIEYLRPIIDTLPVGGRLTGRLELDGPDRALRVRAHITLFDTLVAGVPVSRIDGSGVLGMGGPTGVTFRDFRVDSSRLDLRTVNRLIPSIELSGFLSGAGVLNGPWREVEFRGELAHEDPGRPVSRANGVLRVDAARDTTGIWAELDFDSLNVEGMRGTYPAVPVSGAFSGHLSVAGYLDSLAVAIDLRGRAGVLNGGGVLELLPEESRGTGIELNFSNLELRAVRELGDSLPETRFNGRLTASFVRDTQLLKGGTLKVTIDSGTVFGAPLDTARMRASLGPARFELTELKAFFPGGSIEAAGGLPLGDGPGGAGDTIVFRADLRSLAPFRPVLAELLVGFDSTFYTEPLSGDFAAKGVVTAGAAHPEVESKIEINGITWGTAFVDHAVLALDFAFADGWKRKGIRVAFTVDSLRYRRFAFTDVDLEAAGPIDSLDWSGRIRAGSEALVVGGGRAESVGEDLRVTFDSLGTMLSEFVWFADPGGELVVSDTGFGFNGLALASVSGQSRVSVEGFLPFSGSGSVDVTAVGLPLREIWALQQLPSGEVDGQVSGTVQLGGNAGEPEFNVSMSVRNGRYRDLRAPLIEGHLTYLGHKLKGDLGLFRRGRAILSVDVNLPVNLALTEVAERQEPGPIEITVTADGADLTFLSAVTEGVSETKGTLEADFGITGTWAHPELTGTVSVTAGEARLPGLGVRYKEINGSLDLSGDTIRIRQLALRSGGGQATVSGFVRLERLTSPILNLDLSTRKFEAINLTDFLSMKATSQLHLAGPVYGATVTGEATINQGVLYFADLINKQVINIEDTLFAAVLDSTLISQQRLGADFESRLLDSLNIRDTRVRMGSEMWLRSSEANIQLQGEVIVNKRGREYRLDGDLTTPRGTYSLQLSPVVSRGLVTREFQVTRGEVRYLGTPDLDAQLDIDARHIVRNLRRENITVQVHLGGTLYAPELTLSSDVRPPLSDTEIISYLLFGAPSFQAFSNRRESVALQGVEEVLGSLTGQLESGVIPADYFAIRPRLAGSAFGLEIAELAEIAIGWQLGPKTFVTASPRICAAQATRDLAFGASLEYRFSREFLLAASLDPVRGCATTRQAGKYDYQIGADLFWEKRY